MRATSLNPCQSSADGLDCLPILPLHFGTFELIALAWQTAGVNAQAIMQKPISSHSLSKFWGKRWNLGFRQLSHEFVFQPLHKAVGTQAAMLLVFRFPD